MHCNVLHENLVIHRHVIWHVSPALVVANQAPSSGNSSLRQYQFPTLGYCSIKKSLIIEQRDEDFHFQTLQISLEKIAKKGQHNSLNPKLFAEHIPVLETTRDPWKPSVHTLMGQSCFDLLMGIH